MDRLMLTCECNSWFNALKAIINIFGKGGRLVTLQSFSDHKMATNMHHEVLGCSFASYDLRAFTSINIRENNNMGN